VVAMKLRASVARSASERAAGPLRVVLPSGAVPRESANLPPIERAVEDLPWLAALARPTADSAVARLSTDMRADLGRVNWEPEPSVMETCEVEACPILPRGMLAAGKEGEGW